MHKRPATKPILLVILFLIYPLSFQSLAQSNKPAPVSSQAEGAERIKRFEQQLEELRVTLKIPGMSAAIVKDQQVIWAKGFGYSDYEKRVAATAETPYEIASLTKTFAATLLMQLVEQGKVSLDDPMSKYSDQYKDDSVKVRHVLTHTSEGIPGERYQYNGNLFGNLFDVIVKASGQRLRTLLVRNILERIGTTGTAPGNDLDADPKKMAEVVGEENEKNYLEVMKRLAKPYKLYGADEIIPTYNSQRSLSTATGMISTVNDLAKYDAALDRNLFLKKVTQEEMWTPAVSNNGQRLPYGLGWFVQQYQGLKLVWHYGYLPDLYSALILKVPEKRITFIVLANSDALSSPFPLGQGNVMRSGFACRFLRSFVVAEDKSGCEAASQGTLRDWLKARRTQARKAVKIDFRVYEAYVGQYQLDSGALLTITLEDGKLMRQGKVLKMEMFPESETKFFTKVNEAQYIFVKDDKGRVTQLKILQGDEEALAKKIN